MRKRKFPKPFARGASLGSRNRLFALETELLLVEGIYVEKYRKYPYEDITTICWVKHVRLFRFWLVAGLLLMSIGGLFFLNQVPEAGWVFLIIGAFPLLFLLGMQLQGGPVITYICTPAQQTRITAIRTKCKLDKLMDLLSEKGVVPAPQEESDAS